MNKKQICMFLVTIIILVIPTQIFALSPTITKNETDGTVYKVTADYSNTYINGSFFELTMEVEAVTFGTLEGVIVAFYDIEVDISITADSYLRTGNITLLDINSEGGSSSSNILFNLSDITDDDFQLTTHVHFKGNNTQGDDPSYGFIWVLGMIRVKEASASIILPILAVLSIAYIANKKWKK